jgi:double-stranded uracil-DNA glycosylase
LRALPAEAKVPAVIGENRRKRIKRDQGFASRMMTNPDGVSLPDYLRPGLRIVFVGINPSIYSVEQGHYFARTINRFWPALSKSTLSAPIRTALGKDRLTPTDDASLLDFGIGFTDVVKRPTRNVSQLSPDEFRLGAAILVEKLIAARPDVACFQGLTGYRPFVRHGLGVTDTPRDLGSQPHSLGESRIFVVPSPSPANAHFTPADQVLWYDRLDEFCRLISGG